VLVCDLGRASSATCRRGVLLGGLRGDDVDDISEGCNVEQELVRTPVNCARMNNMAPRYSPKIKLEDLPYGDVWHGICEDFEQVQVNGYDTTCALVDERLNSVPRTALHETLQAFVLKISDELEKPGAWARARRRLRYQISKRDRTWRSDPRYVAVRGLLADIQKRSPRQACWVLFGDPPTTPNRAYHPLSVFARDYLHAHAKLGQVADCDDDVSAEHVAAACLEAAFAVLEGPFKNYLQFLTRLQFARGEGPSGSSHDTIGSLIHHLAPSYRPLVDDADGAIARGVRNACGHGNRSFVPAGGAVHLFNNDKKGAVIWECSMPLDGLTDYVVSFFQVGELLSDLRVMVVQEAFLETGMAVVAFEALLLHARGIVPDASFQARVAAAQKRLQA
jgi:hypothetical protein